jgi:hypothetical protein
MRDPQEVNHPVMEERTLNNSKYLYDDEVLTSKEYIRPRMDSLRDYEINIRFLSLGCIVRVGCKEIAFTSITEAMQEVNEYVANPRLLEQKYNKLINQGNG